jgi:creatinine amidohydrolase
MADMTFAEAREHLKTDKTLIVPVGTCEQHGYHLPLNNDTLMVEYFADLLSQKTGHLIVPTVNYGVNLPCDRLMPGTATITSDLLRGTIVSITGWWRSQGYSRFILLTFHGDPFHIEALSNIGEDVYLIEPYEIEYAGILEKQSTMRHACEAETSVALYLYPQEVRMPCVREHDIPYNIFEDYLFHRKNTEPEGYVGNLGFPSAASAEKGRILVERMTAKMMADYCRLGSDPQNG